MLNIGLSAAIVYEVFSALTEIIAQGEARIQAGKKLQGTLFSNMLIKTTGISPHKIQLNSGIFLMRDKCCCWGK